MPLEASNAAMQSLRSPNGSIVFNGAWDPQAIFDTITPHGGYWTGKRVLDNGANTLGLSLLLARAGAKVVALEPGMKNDLQRYNKAHYIALKMARGEGLSVTLHSAELFDAHSYGKFDEVLCIGLLYHFRYPQFTIDYLSTFPTKTVVLGTQTHPVQGQEQLAMYNRQDKAVWPLAGKPGRHDPLLTGWHMTRPLLKRMLENGGFANIESLTPVDVDFPKKARPHLTNSAYYRARVAEPVDPFKAYRVFMG